MDAHLVDGTYELFRHFFAVPAASDANGQEVGAVRGVLASVLSMIEAGATHIGVATDHVVESFRNDLYAGYKTAEGVPPELLSQFPILEQALQAMGVVVWPMVYFEADDALASAAAKAAQSAELRQVFICTPDKDLAQCVVNSRVVQFDRRQNILRDEAGVVEKFGRSRLGSEGRRSCLISVFASRKHPEGLAAMASIHQAGPRSRRIAVQHMGRCPLVSHARDPSPGCACVRQPR
jgi:5'-3' exonuclease